MKLGVSGKSFGASGNKDDARPDDMNRIEAAERRLDHLEDRLSSIENKKRFRVVEIIYLLVIIAALLSMGMYLKRNGPDIFQHIFEDDAATMSEIRATIVQRFKPMKTAELEPAETNLAAANTLLLQHELTWPDVSQAFVTAEAEAKASAYAMLQARTAPAQEALLNRIEKEFVDSYFSFGGDMARSVGCLVRVFICDGYIERDFERHFSGINDTELLAAWRTATLPVLERYELEKRTYLQIFSLRNDLTQTEFTKIMNGLSVEPTDVAYDYAQKAGLLKDGKLASTSNFLGATAFSIEVYETIREQAIRRARQQALKRANARAAQFAGTSLSGAAGAAGRSAAIKAAGRATIVIGIALEVIAEIERGQQREAMMEAFRVKFIEEELRYFEEAIAYANAASFDKDIIVAIDKITNQAEV